MVGLQPSRQSTSDGGVGHLSEDGLVIAGADMGSEMIDERTGDDGGAEAAEEAALDAGSDDGEGGRDGQQSGAEPLRCRGERGEKRRQSAHQQSSTETTDAPNTTARPLVSGCSARSQSEETDNRGWGRVQPIVIGPLSSPNPIER